MSRSPEIRAQITQDTLEAQLVMVPAYPLLDEDREAILDENNQPIIDES